MNIATQMKEHAYDLEIKILHFKSFFNQIWSNLVKFDVIAKHPETKQPT